jgi:hypothetical protein
VRRESSDSALLLGPARKLCEPPRRPGTAVIPDHALLDDDTRKNVEVASTLIRRRKDGGPGPARPADKKDALLAMKQARRPGEGPPPLERLLAGAHHGGGLRGWRQARDAAQTRRMGQRHGHLESAAPNRRFFAATLVPCGQSAAALPCEQLVRKREFDGWKAGHQDEWVARKAYEERDKHCPGPPRAFKRP